MTLCAAVLLATAQAQTIDITFNGTSATVDVPAAAAAYVSYTTSGANVAITAADNLEEEYTYHVTGTTTDGSLVITGNYKLTLQLDGVDITNAHGGSAIDIECGKRIAVELVKGTVNRLADADVKKAKQKAAFYFKGHPEFEGAGTLFVTGNLAHAISAKEYMQLKPGLGTINILGAVKDGLHCGRDEPDPEKNYFLMNGGTINMQNVKGDGIDSGDYGTIRIDGGSVALNLADGSVGLKADSTVTILGGRIAISADGTDSQGIRSRYCTDIRGGYITATLRGNGSKGIKSKRVEPATDPEERAAQTVLNGGYLRITGGTIDIRSLAGNIITPAEEGPADTTFCMGISVDADLTQKGGAATLTALGPEARNLNVKGTSTRTAGTLDLIRAPWQLDPDAYQYDMSAYAQVISAEGAILAAYDDLALGAFIGDDCVGYAVFLSNLGLLRIHANTPDAQAITFRLYNYADEKESNLTPVDAEGKAIAAPTFAATTLLGTPKAPLLLALAAEDPDAIEAVQSVDVSRQHPRFNLSGQRVGPDYKGIVIINGKKVLQK